MSDPADNKDLDQALASFSRVLTMMHEQQRRLEQQSARRHQLSLIVLVVLVGSLSLLMMVLSSQLPAMTTTVDTMNRYFTSITDDMGFMRRSMAAMDANVQSMPTMLRHIDQIHAGVEHISGDVAGMTAHMQSITASLDQVTAGVVDMRQSFQAMDESVDHMTRDVRQMSKPMNMFNQMNPFR